MDRENIIGIYYEELQETKTPGNVIARFFWEIFSKEPDKNDIIKFNKLIKLYGRDNVFSAVIDIATSETVDLSRYYGLLLYILKQKLENKIETEPIKLTDFLDSVKKDMKKRRNIKDIKGPLERETEDE